MLYKSSLYRLLFFLVTALTALTLQAAPDAKAGEALFKAQCASCHNKNMKDKLTGPALGGAQDRWGDDKALYSWIRNSQALIASGHPKATELWNQWKPTIMTAFPALKDEEIASILLYVDGVYKGTYGPKKPEGPAVTAASKGGETGFNWWLAGVVAILALLAFALAMVISNLDALSKVKAGELPARKTFTEILTSKGVVAFLVFALVVLGGYTTVNNAISMGRQQGYQPEQPIKFSHATHAGLHKIDCQYCHDGARRSKQSVIPAANTCMNCHRAIKVGSKYGTEEITKIYASIGYDPSADKYLENYASMKEEDIAKIYKKWIGDKYNEEKGTASLDANGAAIVATQWNNIKESLTNAHKKSIQGPIEWIRIHNLPDHAYFNHAQHVAVGQVACQKCHGKVEEMDVVRQVTPLSMGWCVNCHRETEVKFKDNPYYKSYETYHKELKEGKREKVTVEDIGGLECQKCHY